MAEKSENGPMWEAVIGRAESEGKGWRARMRYGRGSYWNALNCLYCWGHNLSIQRVPGELLRASWARKVILTFWENDLWTFVFYFLNLENKNAHVWYWVRCVKLEGERKLPKGRVIRKPGTDILKYKRDRWKMKKKWEENENTSQTYLFLVKVL